MNYAKIRNYDIANGEGVRTSLFVSGCTNHCPGCFNPEEQDFNCGRPFTKETIAEIHKMLANPVISGLSLLGGDPLCQDYCGIHDLIDLCTHIQSVKPCGYGLDLSGRTVITLFSRIKTRMITNLHKWPCLHHVML